MRRLTMSRIAVLLVSLALAASGCGQGVGGSQSDNTESAPVVNNSTPPVTYDGHWSGTTSQDKAISFDVENGAIASVELEWRLPLEEPCSSGPSSPVAITEAGGRDGMFFYPGGSQEPPKITRKAFKLAKDNLGPAGVKLVLTGQFGSDEEASGTLQLTASGRCKGDAKAVWKAGKESKKQEK